MFKCVVITKKKILGLFLVLACFVLGTTIMAAFAEERKIPIYCVDTNEKKIAITFDCAWEDFDTDSILSVLKKYDAKATFFVTGDYVRRCSASVKKFYEAGHDIGNHSDNHPHPNNLTEKKLKEDTKKCSEEIKKLGIEEKKLYRSPYGEYNNKTVSTIEEMGYFFIQWDTDSLDYTKISTEEIVKRVSGKAKEGSVVLFHTGVQNTSSALDKILEKFSKEGYSFVTVDELIYKENYKTDAAGKQIRN